MSAAWRRLARVVTGVTAVAALGGALAMLHCAPSASPPEHVLLVTIDTLRPDHLGMSGYSRETSPAIDRWFGDPETAVIFRRAYATEAATPQSVVSILSGLHPPEHGVRLFYQHLPRDTVLLPDLLHAAGYRCAAVVSNVTLTGEALGMADRFDHYDDFVDERESGRDIWERNARRTTDAALAWLSDQRHGEQPFFLWVHYMDPHGPYAPPPDRPRDFQHADPWSIDVGRMQEYVRLGGVTDGLEYIDRYDEEIAYCDSHLGRLLDAFEETGLLERTLVVFAADHGETMMEHEIWFAHQYQVHEPIARVPLALRIPGRRGREVTRAVSLVDVAPTILALVAPDGVIRTAGGAVEVPDALRGRSLLGESPSRDIFIEATDFEGVLHRRALVRGRWKWVLAQRRADARIVARRLYDLERDPAELQPLDWRDLDDLEDPGADGGQILLQRAADDPDPAGVPRNLTWGSRLAAPKVRPGIDPSQIERLRALGYVK